MEQLTLALVLTLGFAARCYMRMRASEKRASHLAADNAFKDRQIENQRATIADLVSEVADRERLRKDAMDRYLAQLEVSQMLQDQVQGMGAAE
jgi:hypothetical protein